MSGDGVTPPAHGHVTEDDTRRPRHLLNIKEMDIIERTVPDILEGLVVATTSDVDVGSQVGRSMVPSWTGRTTVWVHLPHFEEQLVLSCLWVVCVFEICESDVLLQSRRYEVEVILHLLLTVHAAEDVEAEFAGVDGFVRAVLSGSYSG